MFQPHNAVRSAFYAMNKRTDSIKTFDHKCGSIKTLQYYCIGFVFIIIPLTFFSKSGLRVGFNEMSGTLVGRGIPINGRHCVSRITTTSFVPPSQLQRYSSSEYVIYFLKLEWVTNSLTHLHNTMSHFKRPHQPFYLNKSSRSQIFRIMVKTESFLMVFKMAPFKDGGSFLNYAWTTFWAPASKMLVGLQF